MAYLHQPGTRYSYRYKTQTTLDDKRTAAGETKTRVSLAADVDAEAVWLSENGDEKLIKFEVCLPEPYKEILRNTLV